MKLKRILAVSAACAVAAAGLSVQAGAAGGFKLLTEPMSTVDGAIMVLAGSANSPLYYHNDEIDGFDGLFDITAEDLKEWRSTGEFTYKMVESDLDFDRDVRLFNDSIGYGYLQDGKIVEWLASSYDGNKLEIIKDSNEWFFQRLDGWIVSYEAHDDELSIFAVSTDGVEITKSLTYDVEGGYTVIQGGNSEYLAYVMYSVGSTETTVDEYAEWGMRNWDVRIDGLTRNGELKNIYSGINNYWGSEANGLNYMIFGIQNPPVEERYNIFIPETGEILTFRNYTIFTPETDDPRGAPDTILKFEEYGQLFGSKMIVYGTVGTESAYYLVEFDMDSAREERYFVFEGDGVYTDLTMYDINVLSSGYKSMSTTDGEIYLVQTNDDKWGYMNADGELLAVYDDAGEFNGKYDPVVKDGKTFLINRSFKRVSEKIDAENVWTIDKGLYGVTIDGEQYFMTYASAQEEQSEPEDKPEETAETAESAKSDEEAPSEPTQETPADSTEEAPVDTGSNDKTNPDTGFGSAGAALAVAVAAAGAVVLSRKRK